MWTEMDRSKPNHIEVDKKGWLEPMWTKMLVDVALNEHSNNKCHALTFKYYQLQTHTMYEKNVI